MISSIARHQSPKMESMENVPNSQKFSPSQEGEKLRVIPAAVEAGCETMEVSKTPPSPVAMDHQLKGEEVEGDMFEEASLSEEETESKMETESSKPTTMTTAQGSSGSSGESVDTTDRENLPTSNPPAAAEEMSTSVKKEDEAIVSDTPHTIPHFPVADESTVQLTTTVTSLEATQAPPTSSGPTPTPAAPTAASQSILQLSKPFNCRCGRNFDTRRGLSMHWAHDKHHRYMDLNKPAASSSEQAPSEPTSPLNVTPSPVHSPTSAVPPESPPYNMASFKTSARNPQYYSIIRTRRSSEQQSNPAAPSSAEVGTKRPRGSTGSSTTPPAKAMQLNTREKVPVGGESGEGEREGEGSEATPSSSSPQKRRPREKDQKNLPGQQRPRTRSLSSSDNVSPPLKSSLSLPNEMMSGRGGGGGSRSSPVTRSNAATMKTHEFISLPARRRRGGGRRGRGRGGGAASGGRGHDNMEEEREEETEDNESQTEEHSKEDIEPPQQAPPPVKRRRGRPPKNRNKEALSTVTSKSAPSSTQTTPTVSAAAPPTSGGSSSAKQTRMSGRGGGRGGRAAAVERESVVEEQEENPLNIKGSKLPPWESEKDVTMSKQQSSEASIASNESASLPPSATMTKHHLVKSESASATYTAAAASSVTKEGKSKNVDSSNSEGGASAQSHTGKAGRKTSVSSKSSKAETAEVATEGVENEKEIKTRSKAKNSRKASESQNEKEAPPTDGPAIIQEMEETEEGKSDKSSTTATRPSSVIVSVLSGPEPKPTDQTGTDSGGGSPSNEVKNNQNQSNGSAEDRTGGDEAQQFKPPVNDMLMMGYPPPPTSAPTPTYPYSYSGGPYPPIMYPSGPPASSMYPFYYHPGSAGSQAPPMMPHPYHISPGMPPPPVMMPTEQQGGSGTGLPSPHHSMNPYQFQTTAPSPNGTPPNTTAIAISSGATTVGGVRVTLLDKPPTQMPTVTVPGHPNVSRSHPSPTNVYPSHAPMADHAGNPTSPMGPIPLIRPPYMPTPSGAHSPEGIPPHPLSQVYRMSPGYPGPLPHPHQAHYHHSTHPHLAVRFDAGGNPYMNWEPKPPPPEAEQPAQPVECPECGRMFKNNKALNGHMRLHGGFDWTKRPFSVDQKQGSSSSSSSSSAVEPGSSGTADSDAKGKGAKASAVTKKDSRSRSRSRSKSPAPTSSSTKQAAKRRASSDEKSSLAKDVKLEGLPVPRAPNVFTFDTKDHHTSRMTSSHHHGDSGMHDASTMTFSGQPSGHAHRNATLDDLVRAAEELERIENGSGKKSHDLSAADTSGGSDVDEAGRRRPKNITIPQSHSNPSPAIERERHRFGATPPYTPPPILSPSRSLTMLATAAGAPQPCTPSRILHTWSSRRSSEGQKPSESDDSYTEPRINVGKEFQAVLPECSPTHAAAVQDDYNATRVWDPLKELTHEDESIIDGYLQLACSPAVLYGGRNMELAYHYLYQLGGSIKEAVRVLLSGKSVFPEGSTMQTYNYCGSKRWSGKERQQFRRAWRVHRKQFQLLRSAVDSKNFQEVTEFYYTWKKYCSDEYRGRNRHTSEEILSDEDAYPEVPSSGSSASVENETLEGGEAEQTLAQQGHTHFSKGDKHRNNKHSNAVSQATNQSAPPLAGQQGGYHPPRHYAGTGPNPVQHHGHVDYDNFPVVYSAHKHGQVHQYKCKYPGCNQVFTSIFALNGHIRVHGGSFYPRPSSGSGGHSSSSSHHHSSTSSTGSQISTFSSKQHSHSQKSSLDSRSAQQLDIAKALLDLPQSRSPARGPFSSSSQKSSPGKSRSPATKKKMSSSSPGEREGYYPCNRCGRVFTKVKSRSAHMKSHIIKQN